MATKHEIKSAKGVRDWHGRQAILRNRVKDTLRALFERYGFSPLETPMIEREELLSIKGGGEIQKEVFRLQDQGKRDLALRFDHTVPLARFYANNPDLKIPYKRYAIGEVFRDGPTQPDQGRYRIFTQCDVDVVGVGSMAVEAELLTLAADAFEALGLGGVVVKLNNRKALDGIMDYAQVPSQIKSQTILILDKLEKFGEDQVRKELASIAEQPLSASSIDMLLATIAIQGTNAQKIDLLNKIITSPTGTEGLREIEQVFDYCEKMGLDFVEFDPSLARGLDYYTGTTFEVFLRNKDAVSSAIVAGGRFDNMIGDFKGSRDPVPAIGISFGLERICMTLESTLTELSHTTARLFIIPLKTPGESLKIAHMLRKNGIYVDIDLTGRSLKAAMRYANSLNIPFVGIIGEDELAKGVITVKRFSDGVQSEVRVEDVKEYLEK
ncbi:MAG TPA: histidine--tRNA ligase [Thermodesulfovibrionia bacterium]|nr:histidine--tRNA ligase [Thermodesulfovibrionia bacterium]